MMPESEYTNIKYPFEMLHAITFYFGASLLANMLPTRNYICLGYSNTTLPQIVIQQSD